jgi:hypothetical protein
LTRAAEVRKEGAARHGLPRLGVRAAIGEVGDAPAHLRNGKASLSIAAISKRRTERAVRNRAKRGGFESQGVHK